MRNVLENICIGALVAFAMAVVLPIWCIVSVFSGNDND